MKTNEISLHDNQNVNGAKSELQHLNAGMNTETSIQERRKAHLAKHIESLKENNNTFLSRLTLPKEDKALLRMYGEKQLEAAEIVLTGQNKALSVIAEGQLTFIKEVVNTLLSTGRSGMQSAAAVIYKENALEFQSRISDLTERFYHLIESKFVGLESRNPVVQKMILSEIDLMSNKWMSDTETLMNDFSKILSEKV